MSSDEMRQLNEDFAEKVLGWTYQTFPDGVCPHVKHWYTVDGEIRGQQYFNFDYNLTAAWAGVEKRGWRTVEFSKTSNYANPSSPIVCDVELWDQDKDCYMPGCGTGITPAEALVRACLEAVRA